MTVTTDSPPAAPGATHRPARDVDVAIVGSGFSGLGMAIALKRSGRTDFVVLERAPGVGGTWHWNTYPGCRCDVPSHLYSFSFAPNPDWTETYSAQPEIRAYLERCADRFGIRPFVRFGCDITAARWDEPAGRWLVETTQGRLRARVLVSGTGPLTEPKFPDVPGLASFEGETFHSARWNHAFPFDGKRVAAIGTGASAIQFVPAIAPRVARLHVVQRTPPWVMPHTNRRITAFERRLYGRIPALQRLVRGGVYAGREWLVLGFAKDPRIMQGIERLARKNLRAQVPDPELARRVTPGYTLGCKRILPSNDWYPALQRDNVELLTGGIKEIRPRSIVTGEGVEREVDAILFGTGFQVTEVPVGRLVRGRDGRSLDEIWRGSPRAHLGTAVPGFPNFFLLLGPNTGLGHSSMIYMIESQIAHVMAALRTMDRTGAATIEVRAEAEARYNAGIDARMRSTVWSTGCASWYLDRTGRNATLWPDWTWRFRRQALELRPADYVLGRVAAAVPVPAG